MQVIPDVTARLAAVQEIIAEEGLTGILLSPGPDLRYLTGYEALALERLTCLVVPASGAVRIVVPRLEAEAAADSPLEQARVEVLSWEEDEDPFALVASLLPSQGRIAVNDRMWAAHALALRQAMPELIQRAAGSIIGTVRIRKTDEEVAALREAAAAIDGVHAQVSGWLRTGRSELEVGSDIKAAILRAGHAAADFCIVAAGPNAARPHHMLSERRLREGDAVVVDIGGTMPSGYCSDCTRTYVMGAAADGLRAAYAVLREAQQTAYDTVAPDVATQAVDAAARDIIDAAGYGEFFTHRTGHGIGLETHEQPYIGGGSDETLDTGMAFSIEPGIYVPGDFGMRLEDIVVCTANGGERLNSRPRELLVVDV